MFARGELIVFGEHYAQRLSAHVEHTASHRHHFGRLTRVVGVGQCAAFGRHSDEQMPEPERQIALQPMHAELLRQRNVGERHAHTRALLTRARRRRVTDGGDCGGALRRLEESADAASAKKLRN